MDNVKKLGFGLMRLPTKDGAIDIEETARMADLFLERGFRYFDTAYAYNGSEVAFREAVVKRHNRDEFFIASKAPLHAITCAEDYDKVFNTSLERAGVDYFDYYLLHAIRGTADEQEKMKKFRSWEWLFEKKAAGKIRHAGFSFHGTADMLDKLLTEHPNVDFVQLQINYADWDDESVQSRLNWETAKKHGVPVVIMEPVKGGSLVTMPEHIQQIFKDADPEASVASWAVRYAASLEGVAVVLSGMSDLQQLTDNTDYMTEFKPLTDDELKVIGNVRAELAKIPTVPCTACRYCVDDCPQHINIPSLIKTLNTYTTYGNLASQKRHYGAITKEAKASDCIGCQNCEGHCPQGIHISEHMKKIAELFE